MVVQWVLECGGSVNRFAVVGRGQMKRSEGSRLIAEACKMVCWPTGSSVPWISSVGLPVVSVLCNLLLFFFFF